MKGGSVMVKKHTIRVRSTAKPTGNGRIQIRTSISNGHTTKTTTKTIRAK